MKHAKQKSTFCIVVDRLPEEELFRETEAETNRISYPKDDLRLYEGPKVQEVLQTTKGRNFAWSETEKNGNT